MPPETSEDAERCARLADQYGFDGNLFLNLFYDLDGRIDVDEIACGIRRQIEMIPHIIAEIDSSSGARYLGDGRVESDGRDLPVLFSNPTHRKVLEYLVEHKRAMTPDLAPLCSNLSVTISDLHRLDDRALEPFIKRPARKNGGYCTTIVDARPAGKSMP